MSASSPQFRSDSLLAAAKKGDADAFCAIAREHEPRMLSQAMSLCRDQSVAEDLVQETLIEAWKSVCRFDGSCRLSTWLYAILLHRHRKALRYARVRPFFCLNAEARDEALRTLRALEGTPEESASEKETAEALRHCVAALPQKQRSVIQLRFFADASLEEIAGALDCSLGTVKSRLFHALKNLRKMNLSVRLGETEARE